MTPRLGGAFMSPRVLRANPPEQSRAARRLLNWSRIRLAGRSSVSETTISKFEEGLCVPSVDKPAAIRAALEAAGIEFTNGEEPGVRMKSFKLKDGRHNAFPLDTNSKFFCFAADDAGKDVTIYVEDLALDRLNDKIKGSADYLSTLEANRTLLLRIAQIKYERGAVDPQGNVLIVLISYADVDGH